MERLEIKNTSQKLLLETLSTIALPPQYVEIMLLYKGLDPFCGVREGVSNKYDYFSLCKKHGIVPMCINFKYNPDENIFSPDKSRLLFNSNSSNEIIKAESDCIIKGGKISNISFEIETPAKKGLQTLLETKLDKLIKQQYNFQFIDIVLNYFCFEKNITRDTCLMYTSDSLILDVGKCDSLKEKDSAKLTRWFKKLQKKYEK